MNGDLEQMLWTFSWFKIGLKINSASQMIDYVYEGYGKRIDEFNQSSIKIIFAQKYI